MTGACVSERPIPLALLRHALPPKFRRACYNRPDSATNRAPIEYEGTPNRSDFPLLKNPLFLLSSAGAVFGGFLQPPTIEGFYYAMRYTCRHNGVRNLLIQRQTVL